MAVIILFLETPEETHELGRIIGEHLKTAAVITLSGDLGAGKTCLTRGLAQGLDVPETMSVVSPTFTLANEYPGRLPLFHLDVYRLEGDDFGEAGLDEYFDRNGITVIEWAEKIQNELPEERMHITLSLTAESGRIVRIEAMGESFAALLPKLETALADFKRPNN